MMMKKIFLSLTFLLMSLATAFAQSGGVEMATGLRNSGKIWVVVLVVLTLFIGVFAYMFTIDKRVKKLEKNK